MRKVVKRRRLILEAPLPGAWAERANCRGVDTDLFFPTRGGKVPAWVAELCETCVVLAQCRAYALRWPVLGYWAALPEEQRIEWRRKKREAS